MDTYDRNRRSELLAASTRRDLLDLADRCLDTDPDVQLTAGPEVGSLVLTIREPVEAIRMHLGDVLVTRSEVDYRGVRGWGMRMGDDRAASLAAAICDAEAEAVGPEAAAVHDLCRVTAVRLTEERQAEWSELEPTIVTFEEMDAG